MVSNASDDFPEPESPVNTMSCSRGSSRSTLRRLCSRAPRIRIVLEVSATRPMISGRAGNRTDVRSLRRPGGHTPAVKVGASQVDPVRVTELLTTGQDAPLAEGAGTRTG